MELWERKFFIFYFIFFEKRVFGIALFAVWISRSVNWPAGSSADMTASSVSSEVHWNWKDRQSAFLKFKLLGAASSALRKWNRWWDEYKSMNHHLQYINPFLRRDPPTFVLCCYSDSLPQTGEWPLKSPKRTNGDGNCSIRLIRSVLATWSDGGR